MSTVNGQAALTAATREKTGIRIPTALRLYEGEVLRARVSLDTTAAFTVDDPTVGNIQSVGQRIMIVGIEAVNDVATNLVLLSKVGVAAAIQLGKFELAISQTLNSPIGRGIFSPTDQSGALQVSASGATGGNPVEVLFHYVICDSLDINHG